ncbi:flagellar basal body-associated protein FliL [Rhizobium wenxiniae]|uniref:Flagellar basal body-associated protein FliL n=1 Tax=Rhizobium wenxiniae TaxID=1737357 RepID=A0A7W9YA33_9HYPH|nr:flagellar basal body-associated protein FliL [Rhizobium wenxiniae]
MNPVREGRKGLITILALVAALVLIVAVIYMIRMPSAAPPEAQPSPHAIDQGG